MKNIRFKSLLLVIMLGIALIGANSVISDNHTDTTSEEHSDEEGHHHDHDDDHGEAIANHCDNPTKELTISAVEGELAFDQNEYHVDKSTCYKLYFENPTIVDHDVNIDAVDGSVHMEVVHIHVANMNDGPNGDGVAWMNILTPDADTELEIYCSVLGHRDGGMVATLIIGEGNPGLLPINFGYILLSLFSLSLIAVPLRRMKK